MLLFRDRAPLLCGLALIFVVGVVLPACTSGGDPVQATPADVLASISPSDRIDSTYVGDTLNIATPTTTFADGTTKVGVNFVWTSSNPAVLKLDGAAASVTAQHAPKFIPVSEGDAVITGTPDGNPKAADGNAIVYRDRVSVAGAPAVIQILPASVSLQAYQAAFPNNQAAFTPLRAVVKSETGRAMKIDTDWLTQDPSIAAFCLDKIGFDGASQGFNCAASAVQTSYQASTNVNFYGVKAGTTRVTATLSAVNGRKLPTISGATNVTVGGGLAVVTGPNDILYVGNTRQFTVAVRDVAGTVIQNPTVVWSTSDAAIASVDQSGKVTALSAKSATTSTVTVFASVPALGITGQMAFSVSRVAASANIKPNPISVGEGQSVSLSAYYLDNAGNPVSLPPNAATTWSVSGDNIASAIRTPGVYDTAGTLTGIKTGDAVLTFTGTNNLRVNVPVHVFPVVSFITLQFVSGTSTREFNAAGETIAQGASARIVASAVGASGIVFDDQFTFSTTATGITLVPSGKNSVTVTGVTPGASYPITIIAATNPAIVKTANITVTAPAPTGGPATKLAIVATPVNATTGIGGTVQFTANATDANGVAASGCVVGWNTDASSVASIGNATGLATGSGAGATAVRASCNGTNIGSAAKITVTDATYGVTKIAITPKKFDYVSQGATSQFTATVTQTASGATAPIVWSIDAAATTAGVTIDQTGTVRIPTSGSTTFGGGVKITATAAGQTDIAWLTYGYAGSMRGTITSATPGRYLAGSSATATPSTGGAQVSSVVDENGQFYLVGLAPGSYTVSVSEQGVPAGQLFTNVTVTAGAITPIALAVFPIRY